MKKYLLIFLCFILVFFSAKATTNTFFPTQILSSNPVGTCIIGTTAINTTNNTTWFCSGLLIGSWYQNNAASSGLGNGTTVIDVSVQSGATLADKAKTCFALLPSNGGVCDSRGLTGNQTIVGGTSRLVVPKDDTLLLGDAYITCPTAPCITWNDGSKIIGNRGIDSPTLGTIIFYSGKNYFIGPLSASPSGLVRTSDVVTATFSGVTNAPLIGQQIYLQGSTSVSGTNFNNTFTVCGPPTSGCITPTNTSVTFSQTAANDTGGGGTILFPVAVMEEEANLPPSMQVVGASSISTKPEIGHINIRQQFPIINHDGTIGIDLNLSYDANIHDLFIGPLDYGFRLGGTSSGSYYNNVSNIFVSGSQTCGFWASRYSNANNIWGVHIDGASLSGSTGICFDANSIRTTFYSPTIENVTTAITMDGGYNGVYDTYIEAASGGVIFNSTAYGDTYIGGKGTGITNNAPDLAQNTIWSPGYANAPYSFNDLAYPIMFGAKFLKILGSNTWLAPVTMSYTGFYQIGQTSASPSGLVRTSNIVTALFNGVQVAPRIGESVIIYNSTSVGGTTFDGTFTVCGPPTTGCILPTYSSVTWSQTASNDTGGAGTVRFLFSPFMYSVYLPSYNGANQQELRLNPNSNSSATGFTPEYSGSGVFWNAGLGGVTNKGNFSLSQITAPTATAIPTCVTCTATTSYKWVANDTYGSTTGGTIATLTGTAPADLAASTYTIVYASGLPTGTVTLDIYRTATTGTCGGGSCTNGKIGTLSGGTLWNPTGLSFKDTGQTGDGNSTPSTNTTGLFVYGSGLTTPADNATCTAGTFWWDSGYIYLCTASGTVKRATLSTY